jgi:hypothetical protein
LSCCEIVSDAVRGDISTGQEANTDGARLLNELRLRVPCLDTQFHDLLRAAPPSFHKAAPIKGFGD